MRVLHVRAYNSPRDGQKGARVRFRIRRDHGIRPLAYRESPPSLRLSGEDDEWNVVRPTPPAPLPPPMPTLPGTRPALADPEVTAAPPMPAPAAPPMNGFRAQVTAGDVRAERVVREVRMELADLRQAVSGWSEDRDEMVTVDLEAVRANPDAAATLPPAALARALVAAADRIAELERQLITHERDEATLREQVARLHEEHSYTRGRLETLHEVIGALHGNLDDLRGDRRRVAGAPGHAPSLRSPATDEFGTRDQRGGFAP